MEDIPTGDEVLSFLGGFISFEKNCIVSLFTRRSGESHY